MAIIDTLRLIGSPDTNRVMMGELIRLAVRGLGRRPPKPRKAGRGGLIYPFDPALAYLAVRYHRTATRALWDLYASSADRLEPLYDELVEDIAGDARAWLWPGATISVRVRNVDDFAAGPRQIVGTVKNAILDGARARDLEVAVDPHQPDIEIVARMQDDVLTVSIDLAGTSMSQRGYRTSAGAAPLREHLAAVLCMLGRHDARSEVLVDPMCGSGTICIEAALMARGMVRGGMSEGQDPGRREPAMMRIPFLAGRLGDAGLDAGESAGDGQDKVDEVGGDSPRARLAALATGPALFGDTVPRIIGGDIDPHVLRAARDNAARAGVDRLVAWNRGDFSELSPARVAELAGGSAGGANGREPDLDAGLILCNPPYGKRLDDPRIRDLYRGLSRWCSEFVGWRAGFLVANPGWEEWFGRRARVRKALKNGPVAAYFYLYDL